ncbi:MAG: L-2-amino-thiazoline-4-carboxylic acid hydrolase [Eubacteriales bacterium]|nr:L-2-amino-thiazoline-4-carboxylic acid hydrolase [Eubacteriales bacterium]
MGIDRGEADAIIWLLNERMATLIPQPFLHVVGRAYFSGFRKKASAHVARQRRGELHPWDWTIRCREIDPNAFEIDITRCAMQQFAHAHGAEAMLPGICRMDYLFSWLMGNGFQRTKTLGDGDDCCNCHYQLEGSCEWAPEKGFTDRK